MSDPREWNENSSYQPELINKKKTILDCYKTAIVATVEIACGDASICNKSLEGFYADGPGEYPVIVSDQKEAKHFFNKANYGKYTNEVVELEFEKKSDNLYLMTFSDAEKLELTTYVKFELNKVGYRNVVVRTVEGQRQILVGYSKFMHREKYVQAPVFYIYVSLEW